MLSLINQLRIKLSKLPLTVSSRPGPMARATPSIGRSSLIVKLTAPLCPDLPDFCQQSGLTAPKYSQTMVKRNGQPTLFIGLVSVDDEKFETK